MVIQQGERSRSELSSALASCRIAFLGVALISAVVNALYLTGSLFMLEVYDRVLPSRSLPTLLALALVVGTLYAFQGFLDFVRTRLLVRIGATLNQATRERIYDIVVRMPLAGSAPGDGLQPVRDLDQIRTFLSSSGPSALFDLPWMPFYIGICFLFHPWIGATALVGALVLVAITLMTELFTRAPSRDAVTHAMSRNAIVEASRRNAEVLQAMGMSARFKARWNDADQSYLVSQQRAADVSGDLGALSKVLRLALQSALLGVGAYLVIRQEASAGVIIAGSILGARALAPVELAIANWRGFVSTRQGWRRLGDLLRTFPSSEEPTPLPAPKSTLAVEGLAVGPPGQSLLVLQGVGFSLAAGQGLGVIGPSASGKSSLARALVGVWRPARGNVRLDGASIAQWSSEMLGPHVGYLPQAVELFSGSVADNIARFRPDADPAAIIAAAKAAHVHDLITRLPDGYDTKLGEGGLGLSAGQRQRVGLARALFEDPFLVVLDEPNSNLDVEGEEALTRAILGVRERGGIVVVIAHRPSALAGVDHVLMLAGGRQQAFGPKDEVLSRLMRRPPAPAAGATPATAAPLQGSLSFGGLRLTPELESNAS